VEPTSPETSSINWAQLSRFHLKTDTDSSLWNVVLNTNRRTDYVQKHSICINVPLSQTFRPYLSSYCLTLSCLPIDNVVNPIPLILPFEVVQPCYQQCHINPSHPSRRSVNVKTRTALWFSDVACWDTHTSAGVLKQCLCLVMAATHAFQTVVPIYHNIQYRNPECNMNFYCFTASKTENPEMEPVFLQ
jgi:hypothetical protein